MKTIIFFLFIHSSFFVFGQDTIHWSQIHKLKWSDFQGTPDTTDPYAAITNSGIDCSYNFSDTSFTYKVFTFFNKKKSYKTKFINNETLKHEQGHFDITEIFARKLRNRIKKNYS